jgi:hypothetical protein
MEELSTMHMDGFMALKAVGVGLTVLGAAALFGIVAATFLV